MPTGKNKMTYGYTQNTWLESHGTHIHFHAKHRWPKIFSLSRYWYMRPPHTPMVLALPSSSSAMQIGFQERRGV